MPDPIYTKSVTSNDLALVKDKGVIRIIVPFMSGWNDVNRLQMPPLPPPYWSNARDAVLRATIHHEAMWAAAIGIALSKMASKGWEVKSDVTARAKRGREILLEADGARSGWCSFILKNGRDYLCLAGTTKIHMGGDRKGTTRLIRDIVKDKDAGPVMSVDSNGRLVEREITQWHKTPLGDRQWWWVSLETSGHSKEQPGGIFTTDDHPFMTDHGWVKAMDIKPGMMVASGDPTPSEEQCQLLVGTLLGDASMSLIKKRSVIRFQHCVEQESWLNHKQDLLSGFSWTGYKTVDNNRGYGSGHCFSVAVNSLGSMALTDWYHAWYPDGNKIVDRKSVKRYLSPRMLAAWFCDDGTMSTHKTRAGNFTTPTGAFYTNGFTQDDVEWLVSILNDYGIKCSLGLWGNNNAKKYPVIVVSAEGFRSLVKIIGTHVPPSMRYKLPADAPEYNPETLNVESAKATFVKVIDSNKRDYYSGYNKANTTYNIAVSETENFVAANSVVHNCTDNGAFTEIVREKSTLGSKIVGVRHLDSLRCTRTGDPDIPVVYRDRMGIYHELKSHQVIMLSDMPDPGDTYYGVGLCATSRAYKAIFKLAAMDWYMSEKVSGLRPLEIHIVNGLISSQIEGAVNAAKEESLSKGVGAYMGAVIVGTPSDTPPQVVSIPLAGLPDRFNRKEEFDLAVLNYANAIGLDPQELQPLSGQGLGTGTQTKVLDDKAKGKGLALWQQDFSHALNYFIFDDLTEFVFVEKDYRDMEANATVQAAHANIAAARITAQVTSPAQELQVLVDYGDLPKEFLPNDITPGDTASDDEKPDPNQEGAPTTANPDAEQQTVAGQPAAAPTQIKTAGQLAAEASSAKKVADAAKPTVDLKGNIAKLLAQRQAKKEYEETVIVGLDSSNVEFISQMQDKYYGEYGGEKVDPKHITLYWLGNKKDLDKQVLIDRMKSIAASFGSLEGEYNGFAAFAPESGKTPIVTLFDSADLPQLREVISDAMSDVAPEQNHGFTAHTTLVYTETTKDINIEPVTPVNVTFDKICLYWGGDKIDFPLGKTKERLKNEPGRHNQQSHGDRGSNDVWAYPKQEISSAATSINATKLPAAISKINWQPGTVNADIGGGRFDNVTEHLKSKGVTNVIFDPFNRTVEHNDKTIAKIRDGGAHTATVNNVLNVIKEPQFRIGVIKQAANAVGNKGVAYFSVYSGDNSGIGKKSTSGWQENKKLPDYLDEVKSVFSNVKIKNGIIEARNGAQTIKHLAGEHDQERHGDRPGTAAHTPVVETPKYQTDVIAKFADRFPEHRSRFLNATSPADIAKLKKEYQSKSDAGKEEIPDGAWLAFHAEAKERLSRQNTAPTRSSEDARADRILHITNSEGKRTGRKWKESQNSLKEAWDMLFGKK